MVPVGLGLGLLVGWWMLYDPAPTNEELFAQYFVPHHMPVLFVDGGRVGHWNQAAEAYQRQDFPLALQELNKSAEEAEITTMAIYFYQGQCHLAMGDASLAEESLRKVFQEPEGPHSAARWYLALALLKQNRIAECQDVLWEIEGDGGYKSGSALQLLEEF
jgi:tetratricopeptide (TPR) repeat protein